jgi:hypothetical protein
MDILCGYLLSLPAFRYWVIREFRGEPPKPLMSAQFARSEISVFEFSVSRRIAVTTHYAFS